MAALLLRGLRGGEPLLAPGVALVAARRFASGGPQGGGQGANEGEAPALYDAAEQGRPVRTHALVGDPRTGVADDTTQPLHGDLSVEWIWHQQTTETSWYRYALAGRDQLPNMHMDARLSDHSKNLLYLLRCKDPQRWGVAVALWCRSQGCSQRRGLPGARGH